MDTSGSPSGQRYYILIRVAFARQISVSIRLPLLLLAMQAQADKM